MTVNNHRRVHWVYYFGRGLTRLLLFIFTSWKVKGRENLPKDTPVLIVCNHVHLTDPPIVAASLPLKCKFMAKEDLWKNAWSRFWISNFGAFPVHRGTIDMEAIRNAEQAIKDGFSLIVFPEGARSPDLQMRPALPGAALIAMRMKVSIVPVSITGTKNLNRLFWCFFHHPPITVTIGKPFILPPRDGKLPREERREMADHIMKKIAEILPQEYRGAYAAKSDH